MYNNGTVSSRQLTYMLIPNIVSAAIIFLPATAIDISGRDSWICIGLGTVLAVFSALVIAYVCDNSKDMTLYGICAEKLGIPLSAAISALLYCKLIITSGLFLRIFSQLIKDNIWQGHFGIIAAVFIWVCGYGASLSQEQRGRMASIIFPFVIFPLILVFGVGFFNSDISDIRPVLAESNTNILKCSFFSALYFFPLEFLMLYKNRPPVKKAALSSVLISGILITFMIFVLISRFGYEDIKRHSFPLLEIIYSTRIPGAFAERLEAAVLTFMVLGMFFVTETFIYYSELVFNSVLNWDKNIYTRVFTCIAVYFISFLPPDIPVCRNIINIVLLWGDTFFLVILPVILALIPSKKEGNQK